MSWVINSSKRGVSPVIAIVLILGLVLASSVIVSLFINDIVVIDIRDEGDVPSPTSILLNISNVNAFDTSANGYADSILFDIILSFSIEYFDIAGIGYTAIYVTDVDILLPTGENLDETVAWQIDSVLTNTTWDENREGYIITMNPTYTFVVNATDTSDIRGELLPGQPYYLSIHYLYYYMVNAKEYTISDVYQSSLQTA